MLTVEEMRKGIEGTELNPWAFKVHHALGAACHVREGMRESNHSWYTAIFHRGSLLVLHDGAYLVAMFFHVEGTTPDRSLQVADVILLGMGFKLDMWVPYAVPEDEYGEDQ